jgi:hypothetical protein
MPKSNHEQSIAETGEQVPARPHDVGSVASVPVTTETFRHDARDRALGASADEHEVAYAAGWILSSFVTLTTVFAVWIFAV